MIQSKEQTMYVESRWVLAKEKGGKNKKWEGAKHDPDMPFIQILSESFRRLSWNLVKFR